MFDLFNVFFRIGIFTLGGGYAMIPIIEDKVVNKKKWIDHKLFLDLIAVAQSCPGVFAINISIFIGNKVGGTKGALLATLGTAMPSLLCILAIAMFFQNFYDVPWVASMFNGIRPAVVALIAVPTWNLAMKAKLNRFTLWIPLVSALLIWLMNVNPIYIILATGIGGYIVGRLRGTKGKEAEA